VEDETVKWLVYGGIGITAVSIGGYILYTILTPLAAMEDVKFWERQIAEETKKFNEETGGSWTSGMHEVMQRKIDALQGALAATNYRFDVLVDGILILAGVYVVGRLAIDYLKSRAPDVKTSHGAATVIRNAIAIDLYEAGYVSEAIAALNSSEAIASANMAYMNSQIAYLQSLPYLTAMQIVLLNSLIVDVSIIPTLMAAAWAIIV
jgi:hypothetical protein